MIFLIPALCYGYNMPRMTEAVVLHMAYNIIKKANSHLP